MRDKLKTERLRNFYETRIFFPGMPKFEWLTEGDLKRIEGTFGFATFNLRAELSNLKSLILKDFAIYKSRNQKL